MTKPKKHHIYSAYHFPVTPDKKLGQNFLLDTEVVDRVILSAGYIQTDTTIIEVGSGLGMLTRALLMTKARKVIAIEADIRFSSVLSQLQDKYPDRLQIFYEDALKFDERKVLGSNQNKIVANLPYNIGTALLIKWLGMLSCFESITLMLQKEVVDRVVAEPKAKKYGRLSVLAQWLCCVQKVMDITPEAFFPPPKVTSSVLHIIPRPQPLFSCQKEKLETVCQTAFAQRRKMLRSSLKALFAEGALERVLEDCSILPTKRAEELTIQEFCHLATKLGDGLLRGCPPY